jgi:hypothetical protein
MNVLASAAWNADDLDDALQLARQAGQIPDIPPKIARKLGHLLAAVLADAGNLPAAGRACAATLAQARDAGDLNTLGYLLPLMADLHLHATSRPLTWPARSAVPGTRRTRWRSFSGSGQPRPPTWPPN